MGIVLHDLAGRDDRRFSPTCWRTKMALAHKGLAFTAVPTPFLAIPAIGAGGSGGGGGGGFKTVPTIRDGDRWVTDSEAIADHLEAAYPDRPSLFGGAGGRALAGFARAWAQATLHGQLAAMLLVDIHDHLAGEAERACFRRSREAAFKASLEAVVEGREARLPAFRASLEPLRQVARARAFLGGDAGPLYPDHVVLGAFQWARCVSPFAAALLAADDPVRAYLGRLLDLHGGLARRAVGYPL